jgi:hypothetical protein
MAWTLIDRVERAQGRSPECPAQIVAFADRLPDGGWRGALRLPLDRERDLVVQANLPPGWHRQMLCDRAAGALPPDLADMYQAFDRICGHAVGCVSGHCGGPGFNELMSVAGTLPGRIALGLERPQVAGGLGALLGSAIGGAMGGQSGAKTGSTILGGPGSWGAAAGQALGGSQGAAIGGAIGNPLEAAMNASGIGAPGSPEHIAWLQSPQGQAVIGLAANALLPGSGGMVQSMLGGGGAGAGGGDSSPPPATPAPSDGPPPTQSAPAPQDPNKSLRPTVQTPQQNASNLGATMGAGVTLAHTANALQQWNDQAPAVANIVRTALRVMDAHASAMTGNRAAIRAIRQARQSTESTIADALQLAGAMLAGAGAGS